MSRTFDLLHAIRTRGDEIRELNERVECAEANAVRWREAYEKAQSNYLRVVRHQDGQMQEISDLHDANSRLLVALDRLRTKNEALQADNAAAKALRERLDEWKEAHRVKTP